ncbi:MAG: ECF-type sigma factor [Pirellulaceae bacterium]
MSDVAYIPSRIESDDPPAAEQRLPLVYDELRKLAAARLAHEKPEQTLQPTALVHEANRLSHGMGEAISFFATSVESMRRIRGPTPSRVLSPAWQSSCCGSEAIIPAVQRCEPAPLVASTLGYRNASWLVQHQSPGDRGQSHRPCTIARKSSGTGGSSATTRRATGHCRRVAN